MTDTSPWLGWQAHHDFPVALIVDFVAAALDINDPSHGRWIFKDKHGQMHEHGTLKIDGWGNGGRFNYQWRSFFPEQWSSNGGIPPGPELIEDFRAQLVTLTTGAIPNGNALKWPFAPNSGLVPGSKVGMKHDPKPYTEL